MTEQTVRVVLAADPGSVPYARLFVRRQCEAAALGGDDCENAVLLTSELVTAALRGLRRRPTPRVTRPTLTVTTRPGWVRVEVGGAWSGEVTGPGAPAAVVLPAQAVDLVERLAGAWGSRPDAAGPAVWFDVRAAAEQRAQPRVPLPRRGDALAVHRGARHAPA